jgi:uncharacterized membrane protein
MRGMAMIAGPGIFSTVFAIFIAPGHALPGAPWYLAAAMLAAALVMAWIVAPKTALRIPPPLTPEIVAEENPLM